MSDDTRWQQRFEKKLAEAFELHAKLHDALLDLKRMHGGENPVREVMVHFDEGWRGLYATPSSPSTGSDGVHYEFNRTIDPAQIKRLLKVNDLTTLKARITRYFADREPLLIRNKHPFNLFLSRFNAYAPTPPGRMTFAEPDEPSTPSGCRHSPQCKDDIEHTRRKMQEMRT